MKIYTMTGDQGTSSLYNGERRMKSDEVFEVLGDLDELESNIGFAIEFSTEKHSKLVEYLRKCQDILFDVNASIATPRDQSNQRVLKKTEFSGCFTTQLENWIDEFDKDLPKTFSFVIVSGGKFATCLHVCRTICRRAERHLCKLPKESVEQTVFTYINRLSDFLYVAARWAALQEGIEPVKWEKQGI